MKTILVFIIAFLFSLTLKAQEVKKVSLQASGLTCSMCSNSINKSLKSLNFIEKVDADIETSTFEITFKPDATINFDAIKNKVEDAGFYVSRFLAEIAFTNVSVNKKEPVSIGNQQLRILNAKEEVLNGDTKVRIVNKGFLSAKEYKKNQVPSSTHANQEYYAVYP